MISVMQNMLNGSDTGRLKVNVVNELNLPVGYAKVSISTTGLPEDNIMELVTNEDGQTENVELETPPVNLSLEIDNIIQPYAEYTVNVTTNEYESIDVSGIQVMAETDAIQNIVLRSKRIDTSGTNIVIGAHTLYGEYPAKIPESSVKPINETGEIVLSRVVIPEYIVVHDGAPSDPTAKDYYVGYKDYIKNVACSEIYPTWEEETIKANVLAIMSFTLNRVYTEFYRNKGYDFTITSSTAYDHKFIYGRNIFDNISRVVDDIFNLYLSRPNIKQPILTQYCDGKRVSCPDWMRQWESQSLGLQGLSAIEILRSFYGESIYINEANQISGIPVSYPGYDLSEGMTGSKVMQIQEQLDAIGDVYTSIGNVTPDGIYGPATKRAVMAFQKVFDLPQTGIVDFPTWYKISAIYVGITRIAELV